MSLKDYINEQQDDGIDIYFDSLDEETQKKVIEDLRQSLNVTDDDDYANNKIIETLAKNPLFSLRTNELIRQMDFDF